MRPRSPLCSHTCELVPHTTSSTSAVSNPLRSTSALSTVDARCCGCRCAKAPLPCLPMPRGVRHASMMKASAIPRPSLAVRGILSVAGEGGDLVQSGQLVRIADGVDAGDAAVLDGDAHCRVERAADVDAPR